MFKISMQVSILMSSLFSFKFVDIQSTYDYFLNCFWLHLLLKLILASEVKYHCGSCHKELLIPWVK